MRKYGSTQRQVFTGEHEHDGRRRRRRWRNAALLGIAIAAAAGLAGALLASRPATSGSGGTSAAALSGSVRASEKQPNVIFLLIDDMGWNDMGYQSSDLGEMTPFLDSLAGAGIKLTNYYSMYMCTPARASLLTGRYVFRYGLQYSVFNPTQPSALPPTEVTVAEYFRDAGYATHMVGKWHLGYYEESFMPHRRGFQTFLGYLNGQEDYYTHQYLSGESSSKYYFDFGFADQKGGYIDPKTHAPRRGPESIGVYSTDLFTDRAIEVIKEHDQSSPLFLYYASQAMHNPTNPPPDFVFSEEQNAAIDRIVTKLNVRIQVAKVLMYLDMSIKRLMATLEEVGMAENTLLVVASDNGGCNMGGGSNWPLRGVKETFWEGGNRVPAFVYGPGILPSYTAGTKYTGLMHVTDWLPTLAGLAHLPLNSSILLDGKDQYRALTGAVEESPRDTLIYDVDAFQGNTTGMDRLPAKGAIRQGRWKLIVQEFCARYYSFSYRDEYNENTCSVLDGCTSCTQCGNESTSSSSSSSTPSIPASYLFDLVADPLEQFNLIDEYPEIANELYRVWEGAGSEAAPSDDRANMQAASEIFEHHMYFMVPWWHTFETHNATATPDKMNAEVPG